MDADPYKYFKIEAPELLEHLNHGALRLQRGEPPSDVVPTMLRHAHTLKGAARIVRCLDISEQAHRVEDLLSEHRTAMQLPEGTTIADVLATLTTISLALDALLRPASPEVGDQAAANGPTVSPQQRTLRADVKELDEVTRVLGQAIANQARFQASLGQLPSVRRSLDLLTRQLHSGRNAGAATPHWWKTITERTEDLSSTLRDLETELEDASTGVTTQLDTAQQRLEALRLVPVERLFNMLERTALDAALSLGKEVSVTMTGGAHRIDGDVLELLRTGLLHVVRNSVVHGIESPAERGAMGKARIGHIHLAVAELESDVLLSCDDDGGGVNLTAARARLGLRPDTEEREVLQALLVGGASTAGQLSELSGRGVGLDVMRDVSERLGGQLELANRASGGLSVRLRFPARLRLLQGIELQSGDLRVLVPLDQISGALQLDTDERLLQAQRGELGHDGVTLATASLGQALGLSDLAGSERVGMIVAGSDGPVVLLAQRLGEVRQGLLRPLPPHAQASALVAGLVLDPFGLPQLVLNCKHVTTKGLAPARTTARRQAARVLVVDDSLTTRMLEQSILEANGYRVDLASSAEEGLARAAQERFDLFLVDVEMPGMDGFDFIARTQADETLRGVPAVLVSSRSGAADFARGAAVGARGYVVKHQFDQHEFLSLIQRLTRAA